MIQVTDVSKSFGKVRALDGVTLRLQPGERVAFVGPNGSGKTTLLRAILGLVRVSGCITVAGIDVARHPEDALRALAYIPQIAPPLDAPVSELLRAWCSLRGKPEDAVAARAERLGIDLARVSSVRTRDLSGGMKQKLLAALALAAEAPILVCDEPTANLDAQARSAFFAQVDDLAATSLVVFCSHRIEEVRHVVDRVVELREGRVSYDGSVAELEVRECSESQPKLRAARA